MSGAQRPTRALRSGRVLLAGALLAASGCGSDTGAYCCQCLCCQQTVTLRRSDQSWPECTDPCRTFCEAELACHQPVEQAEACD